MGFAEGFLYTGTCRTERQKSGLERRMGFAEGFLYTGTCRTERQKSGLERRMFFYGGVPLDRDM